jgi:phosphatidate phosphatase PAH1
MKKSDKRIIVFINVIFQENSMKLTSNKELNFEKNEENNELLLYLRFL